MATISFKGRHFQRDMILQSMRWYLAYALSYRDIEEMMAERGFSVDHSTINRWVLQYSPQLDAAFRHKKKRVASRLPSPRAERVARTGRGPCSGSRL